jgi:hypothetical protein
MSEYTEWFDYLPYHSGIIFHNTIDFISDTRHYIITQYDNTYQFIVYDYDKMIQKYILVSQRDVTIDSNYVPDFSTIIEKNPFSDFVQSADSIDIKTAYYMAFS